MSQETKVILFNYGGGMRGLVPARLMAHIEERTGLRMADMVDIFCGPSTGSILNAALNVPHPDKPDQPKYRARHMVQYYEREGKHIFPLDRFRDFRALLHDFNNRTMKISTLRKIMRLGHYDPSNLKRDLRKLYGDTRLSETLKSLVVPVYNIDGASLTPLVEEGESDDAAVHTKNNLIDEGGHAVWLKNMTGSYAHKRPAPHVSLYDAVLGSTAAPTYFPCHHFPIDFGTGQGTQTISGIDGSIFDNPCISYHGAIRQHIKPGTRVVMILLATGYSLQSISKDQWNSYGNLGVVDPANDLPLINILFHAPESALLESFYSELGDDLFVFNQSIVTCDPAYRPTRQIDDASPENLKALKGFANAMIENQADQMERLCDFLVSNYEKNQRARNEKPPKKRSWLDLFQK